MNKLSSGVTAANSSNESGTAKGARQSTWTSYCRREAP